MKRTTMAALAAVLMFVGFICDRAQAINPVNNVEYVGTSGGNWSDANAWTNTTTSTTGNSAAIFGQTNGSDGMNTTSLATTRARNITIDNETVLYPGQTIGDLRIRQGTNLTIKNGGVWHQDSTTNTENAWTQMDMSNLILDNGIFRRSGTSTGGDGGGLVLFGSYRDDDNFEEMGGPAKINVQLRNGGRIENNGQLWFGADDEHSLGARVSFTINNGHLDLTGGSVAAITNSTLAVNADLAFFYDYYRDEIWDAANNPPTSPGDYNANGFVDAADYVQWRNGGPLSNEVATPGTTTPEDHVEWKARFGNGASADDPNGQPKNEQWEINFTGPGSITVDSAGIWVYRQDALGIWDEGAAGPLSYQDLWAAGILKAHGLSGKAGEIVPSGINDLNRVRVAANFDSFFTVSGTPGSNDYTLTSIVPTLQEVEYVGTSGGNWSDANAWRNVTTNTTGNSAAIFGQTNGSDGMNTTSLATTRARNITIDNETVLYPGQTIGDLRIRQGTNLTIKNGGVWHQDSTTNTENAWTQMDMSNLILDNGIFRRSGTSTGGDGGGLVLFGSYRDDDNFEEIGGPAKINVQLKNGGRIENNGQLWFGADDEHSVGTRVSFTINNGHLDLTGGSVAAITNSTLAVNADLAFFYDYFRDDIWDAANDPLNDDPNGRPKNEEWEINFTGPGSITVDSAGIWVYRQDSAGIWDEGGAGPLTYEDLWAAGILKAFGLSGKAGEIVPSGINDLNRVRVAANFADFFTTSGTPGQNDYILTSLITAGSPFGLAGQVPEPGTMLLMVMGLASLWSFKRNSR